MLQIRNVRLIDPAQHRDDITDILVDNGRIHSTGDAGSGLVISESRDGNGLWLLPGLIDLGGHLPEPGYTQKGTIESETRAARSGGFTHICSLPDTSPVADTSAVIKLILEKAASAAQVHVLPLAALTQGLAGEQLASMVTLSEAGAVAMSNARHIIRDSYVLRRLMEYAATYDIPVFLSANDAALAAGGCMHEGPVSTRLGLPGIPATAETVSLAKILLLAEQTGARLHISQVSCGRSVLMLRQAREQGLNITADTPLANLLYTHDAILGYRSLYNVQPPLRTEEDRQALLAAVESGELAISSNHRPHEIAAKKAPFAEARPGMSQYDCFLPLAMTLVHRGELSLNALIRALTVLPASVLRLQHGLSSGQAFNACLFNPETEQTISASDLYSQGHNHPAIGASLRGRVEEVFVSQV
ncbi:MAG TPA: dihydroorotase [Oceanospirillales bacterium]|nr:dihydroorotase-like protein [Oceanospirillaceae bacterium]HBS43228.1 dihydroorotase [Oceanospirillales bacterium]|tara:strand:- start:700 stop:1950 length:1251 start_codon:yes stop_codon:yes gene_type:complete